MSTEPQYNNDTDNNDDEDSNLHLDPSEELVRRCCDTRSHRSCRSRTRNDIDDEDEDDDLIWIRARS